MSDTTYPGMRLEPATLRAAAERIDALADLLAGFDTDTLGPSSAAVLADPGTNREMTRAWRRWDHGCGVYVHDLTQLAERLRGYAQDATRVDQQAAAHLSGIHPLPGAPPDGAHTATHPRATDSR
jgi:hypothetical protein